MAARSPPRPDRLEFRTAWTRSIPISVSASRIRAECYRAYQQPRVRKGGATYRSPYPPFDIPTVPVAEFVLAGAAARGHRPALIDAVTGRWIDLLEEEVGELPREEKPSVRKFAREIVDFARSADRAPAVILAWSL